MLQIDEVRWLKETTTGLGNKDAIGDFHKAFKQRDERKGGEEYKTGRSKKGFRWEVLKQVCNAFLVKKDDRKTRGLVVLETSVRYTTT